MLKLIVRSIVAVVLIAGWALAALALHVVITPDPEKADGFKVVVIPKNQLSPWQTYVDTRTWSLADAQANEEVVARMVESGKIDLLTHVYGNEVRDRLGELGEQRHKILSAAEPVEPVRTATVDTSAVQ